MDEDNMEKNFKPSWNGLKNIDLQKSIQNDEDKNLANTEHENINIVKKDLIGPPWLKDKQIVKPDITGDNIGKNADEDLNTGTTQAGPVSDIIRQIEKCFKIVGREIKELEIANIEVFQVDQDYLEPTGAELPIIIQSTNKCCCIEGCKHISEAQEKKETTIICDIYHVENISELGLAVWKYSIRQKTRGGIARYAEHVKYAMYCKKYFLELYTDLKVAERGGAQRGKNIGLWGFSDDEFTDGLSIGALCKKLDDDYQLILQTAEYSALRLNEILTVQDLFDKIVKKYPDVKFPQEVVRMDKRTKEYRASGSFANLNVDRQWNIIKLNRLAVETIYPLITPKSILNQEDDLLTLMARVSEKSRETVREHVADGEYLSEDVLEMLINGKASKSFFKKIRSTKDKYINFLKEDETLDDEYIEHVVGENVVNEFRKHVQGVKEKIEFSKLSDDENQSIKEWIQEFLSAPSEIEEELEENEPEIGAIINIPQEQELSVTSIASLNLNDRLQKVSDQLKGYTEEDQQPEDLSKNLSEAIKTLMKIRDDINNLIIDWNKGV